MKIFLLGDKIMTEDKNKKTPLSVTGRKTLQIKPLSSSGVGHSASGVVVQIIKKHSLCPVKNQQKKQS